LHLLSIGPNADPDVFLSDSDGAPGTSHVLLHRVASSPPSLHGVPTTFALAAKTLATNLSIIVPLLSSLFTRLPQAIEIQLLPVPPACLRMILNYDRHYHVPRNLLHFLASSSRNTASSEKSKVTAYGL
jgi:hypothetical protein